MIQIEEIINSVFSSKTYILYQENESKAWLVDIGDIDPVISFLTGNHLNALGVFLTHGHFDHMYGLLSLLEFYPSCLVFVTDFTKQVLASDKLNLSKYYGASIVYAGDNLVVVHDKDEIALFQ